MLNCKKCTLSVCLSLLLTSFLLLSSTYNSHAQTQLEQRYSAANPDLPEWVKLLYGANPNKYEIEAAYEAYYRENEFVKNQFTQYYKRWLRHNGPYFNRAGYIEMPDPKVAAEHSKQLMDLRAEEKAKRLTGANWEQLGPWEYDHEATMNVSVQSPGAAHVYTVEQSASNPDVVYAGTANAGVWKSTDKGMSWTAITDDLLLRSVYSICIDHSDSNTIYFEGSNRIWKSTDGGGSYTETGGGQYFDWVRDFKMDPTNNAVILAATTDGLYRTDDAGASWNLLLGGHFQEMEFHPTDPSIVYAVKYISGHTEFYKSTDGGNTFSLKTNGWPGVGSATLSPSFSAVDLDGATSTHVTFDNMNLGASGFEDFTIEMRVKSSGWSGDPAIFSNKNWYSGWNTGFIVAGKSNGDWKFNISDGGTRIDIDGSTIDDGQWHHIAVTYDADGMKYVYQDGVLLGSSSDILSSSVGTSLVTALAQDGTLGYGYGFGGQVSDLRVWNTVLSSTDLENWRCSDDLSGHPALTDLVHHYNMSSASGSDLIDQVGTNDGSLSTAATWSSGHILNCVSSDIAPGDEQGRTEISITNADPDLIYVLATGEANGGSGLYGIYKSTDAGESFTFECCGTGPGGPASTTNKNIVGYAFDGSNSGGQYYYDLGLGASPTDPEKVFAAGISVNRSEDGGSSWETNGHWVTWVGANTKDRYTHADVHDVKFFQNADGSVDMWVASDGGLYYSADQGDNIEPRMHGIQGTEFWGFDGSYKEDAMLGGTYHNGTLVHYEDLFLKGKNGFGGWFAGGAADVTKAHVHDADGSVMFETGGMMQVYDRLYYWNWLPFDNSKTANVNGTPGLYGNFEWDPRCYNTYYSPNDSALWKTTNNGKNWEAVHNFATGRIYSVQISNANPDVIYVVQNDEVDDIVKIWRSADAGANWTDITPPNSTVGGYNYKNKIIEVDQTDENTLWFIITGWYGHTGNKVFKTTDGGASWTDLTGSALSAVTLYDISHHQGSNGGIYVSGSNSVFYRDNSMSDWEIFSNGLPASVYAKYLCPYFTEGKMRLGTYRGAYQTDLFDNAPPVAKISVDKLESACVRDTFHFKDLSYVDHNSVIWDWSFPGATPATSNEENPKVVYDTPGTYSVSLNITNAYGTDSQTLTDFITVTNECQVDSIPGQALLISNSGSDLAQASAAPDFGSTQDFSVSFWIKTTTNAGDAAIVTDKNWYSGYNKGWVFSMTSGLVWLNVGDGSERIDLYSTSYLNDGEWHYVAGSFDRDGIATLYIDGIAEASDNMSALNDIHTSFGLSMGADVYGAYDYEGEIEEVKIFNSALSQNEIRLKRHLTAYPDLESDLIHYYQFNRASGDVLDRVSNNHLSLIGSADRSSSSAPLGGGFSEWLSISSAGNYMFTTPAIQLDLSSSTLVPQGDVVGTRIHLNPDQLADALTPIDNYWILNNYGTEPVIDEPISLTLGAQTAVNSALPSNAYQLHTRLENAHGSTWTTNLDQADAYNSGDIVFSTDNGINNLGQFYVSYAAPPSSVNSLQAQLYLEGAYQSAGTMSTHLQDNTLLPTDQPFNASPWFYAGTESVSSLPANVTDWVLLEIRNQADSLQIIEQRAAFIRSDGIVIDLDGTEGVSFSNLYADVDYYMIVRTRNHIDVANALPISLPQSAPYDYSQVSQVIGGTDQLHQADDGTHTLLAGDINGDGLITVVDFNIYVVDASAINKYIDSDTNLDSNVTVSDFNLYQGNASKIGISLVRY